jgi:hypothetical protein
MSVLNLPIGYNWEVRTPIVDRLMRRGYVDSFFQDGSLRLSSFESFRKHPDEGRRDSEEGKAAMKIISPKSNLSAIAFNGQEAYVLCGSMAEARPSNEYACIRIKDTLAFAATAARQIPGFIGGTEGSCIYRANTFYEATDEHSFSPPKDGEDPESWMEKQNAVIGNHMRSKFFIKHARFAAESEYRMVWFCDGSPRTFIDVKCPKAIQFCERVGT